MVQASAPVPARPERQPYASPHLVRLGDATVLTETRLMVGRMDGGSNKSRTG